MEQQIPNNFGEFCDELLKCGFSLGGGSKGIYAIIPYDWKEQEFLDYPAKWHTGDPETDPWEWRMRVLEERSEFAYAKVFFGVSGYITKEWYPYFLSVRRKGKSFAKAYNDGEISQTAKRIYELVSDNGRLAVHEIKQLGGLEKCKDFDKSLTELQMKMYLTMCGRAPKLNKNGEPFGWYSTVFCTPEVFWDDESVFSRNISESEAADAIGQQVLKLNPEASERKIKKFIYG